jgi:general secretion pathway protein F
MKPLSFRHRAELFTQLAKLEAAGLPFERAMQAISLPSPDVERLNRMRSLLQSSSDIAFAGEKSGVFTTLEAKLIRAALNAGSPAATYDRLANHYTERAMQLASMRTKLAYPAFLFGTSLVLTPLPSLVGGDISIFGYVWRVVRPVLALLVGFWLVRRWLQPAPNADIGSRASRASRVSGLPFYGPIHLKSQFRDFFESLALLLEAGVSMLDALPLAADTMQDANLRREFLSLRGTIENGASLHEALRTLPSLAGNRVIEFAETGETSGTLPAMLKRFVALQTADINAFYEMLAAWAPKIVYAIVVAFVAYNILSGGGVASRVIE